MLTEYRSPTSSHSCARHSRVASERAIISHKKSFVLNIIGTRAALARHSLAKCKCRNYSTSDIETNRVHRLKAIVLSMNL